MRRRVLYVSFTIGLLSILVFAKLWVIPFFLWNLFPQNDLMSKIYEVLIIAFGGVAFLLFIISGYVGKHYFQFSWPVHAALHFIAQLPFATVALIVEQAKTPTFMDVFSQGWHGLLAEPARLILMTYNNTDLLAVAASFVFVGIGRKIEIEDEQRVWERARNRVREGRV